MKNKKPRQQAAQTNRPLDKEYLHMMAAEHPHIATFLNELPKRYLGGFTKCDGDECTQILNVPSSNIFVTPGPEFKPMVVCVFCMRKLYEKAVNTGQYDIHPHWLDKLPKL